MSISLSLAQHYVQEQDYLQDDVSISLSLEQDYVQDDRAGHWYFAMVSFVASLSTFSKSFEGCDYGNKPIDLPFQIWIKCHRVFISFAARSVCSKKPFTLHYYIYILLMRLDLIMMFY